jgi:hypothetical protein
LQPFLQRFHDKWQGCGSTARPESNQDGVPILSSWLFGTEWAKAYLLSSLLGDGGIKELRAVLDLMQEVVVLGEMLPIVYYLGGTHIDGGLFVVQGLRVADEGYHAG